MKRQWREKLGRLWTKNASMIVCGLAFLGLPAWAQAPPQPPLNSDLAIRILPTKNEKFEMSPEMLREQPLVRVASEVTKRYWDLDLIDDLHGAFEGTVVAAILSDSKGGSSLARFFKDDELRGQREMVVVELRSLASDLESYKDENDSYPEDFQTFIDEYRYYEPYLPDGASYEYRRTDGGQGFRLVASFTKSSRLGELGPAPAFGHGGVEENVEPTKPRVPLNYVVGARVSDPELAREVATKLSGAEMQNGFWVAPSGLPMVMTLRGQWLVISDHRDHLGPFLKSLNGQTPGLAKDPGYQMVARNIDLEAPLMAFVDLPAILNEVDTSDLPELQRFVNLAGPAGYAVTPKQNSELRMEFFLGARAPQGSALEKLLAGSAKAKPQTAMVASNIPWDVSNVFAVDYRLGKQLFDALLALSDDAKETWGLAEDIWAGYFGLDAEAGFNRLVDGWVVLSFERIDIFVNAFESFFDVMSSSTSPEQIADYETLELPPETDVVTELIPEEGASPEGEATETDQEGVDSEAAEAAPSVEVEVAPGESDEEPIIDLVEPEEPEAPVEAKPARLPFTVAFQVVDEQARKALNNALTEQLAEERTASTMHGVDVVGRKDGLLTYAQHDNWFYISGGNTQRLLRNLLAAATGEKESLTSLQSWDRFRTGQRGQVVAIGHQKLDSLYAMTKGFLLFLGPEYRPLAYELGKLRDYHSAMFIVPDGFLMVGDVLQGDGR